MEFARVRVRNSILFFLLGLSLWLGLVFLQFLTVGLLVIYTRSPTVGPGDTALIPRNETQILDVS